MAGLFRSDPKTREGKYLVQRRDGTVPEWPWFVLGANDPCAPAALRAYAEEAAILGMDPRFVREVEELAQEWDERRSGVESGNPDAPAHRKDNPEIIEKMRKARSA